MTNTAWTDDQITTATHAAAKARYAQAFTQANPGCDEISPAWEELPRVMQAPFIDVVIPVVWAALTALPDPRYASWEEGYIAADNGDDESTNPYSSGV